MIRGGLSLREIAALLDTSVPALERTYSRNIGSDQRTVARLRSVQNDLLLAREDEKPATARLRVVA
jgi:hypothetical protein